MISHKGLSNWYLQLSQHLESGVLLSDSLLMSRGPRLKDREQMANQISGGMPLVEVFENAPRWLPRADRVFICASEQTGRLPQTFKTLSERHEQIGATLAKMALGLVYPLGVFHIAALVLPLVRMIDYEVGFEWNLAQHAANTGSLLIPLWIGLFGLFILAKSDSPLLPRILRCLPILRRYSKKQSLADFSYALGTFVETGVPIQTAWKHSVRLSRDSRIQAAYKKIEQTINEGNDPSLQLKQFAVFPADFVAFYTTGAQTGQLDQNLIKSGKRYQQEANQAMTLSAIVYPSALFALVAGFIIYSIFKVYGGYVEMLMNFAE